jgi:hypothetical protein
MNWRLVLYLSLFGPVIGSLVVMGVFPEKTERFVWLAASLLCGLIIARSLEKGHFQHGALVGFIAGSTSTLVQAIFSATLVTNNPWIVEAFAEMPEGFDLQFFIFMLVPFIGIASALGGGLLAHVAGRVMTRLKEKES